MNLKERLRLQVLNKIDITREMDDEEIRQLIREEILSLGREKMISLEEKLSLEREVFNSLRKFDILQDLLDDDEISEIMINGWQDIFIEKNGKITKSELAFSSEEKLYDVIQQIVSMNNRMVKFPEEDYLEDIEFDEVFPQKQEETKTVLLSEDASVCCGKLIHDVGGESGDFVISHTPFRIGSKDGANDAVIHSPAVSRYHAKITRQDGIYYLSDANSLNGTFHNGKAVGYNESVPLKAMDTISFADVVYHII